MSSPIQSIYFGMPNAYVIGASMAGTAAATVLVSSASFAFAKKMEIHNLTGRNLEITIGRPDGGTADYTNIIIGGQTASVVGSGFFCPGTAAIADSRSMGFPVTVQPGMQIFARTTENLPITCSSTTPLIFNFWA